MYSHSNVALLALTTAVHGLPQVFSGGGTGICLSPIFTGTPPYTFASTPGTAVNGLQLANSNGTAVLQADGYNSRMSFDDSQISVYDGSCTPKSLDIGAAVPGKSYRDLTWSFAENTGPPTWVANFSQTINVEFTEMARVAEFLACPSGAEGVWTLYLLTERPAPGNCIVTELAVSANGLHEVS